MRSDEAQRPARHLAVDQVAVRSVGPRVAFRPLLIVAIVAIFMAGTAVAAWWLNARGQPARPGVKASAAKGRTTIDEPIGLPAPDLLRPLTPQEAIAVNAEKLLAERADNPAASFLARGDDVTKLRALDCLTQAVYYEAASEGVDGGRAVAQIVLNRVRHPSYPNAVCGVVYQGSTRTTGCQFTFTCDGSLRRVPLAYLWARARVIARDALAGRVFAPVGHATHYHADYVVPYWADSLDKVAVVGRHIFYRIRGVGGERGIFIQRYAAVEPLPPLPPSTTAVEMAIDGATADSSVTAAPLIPQVEADRAEKLAVTPKVELSAGSPLRADLSRGTLILGERPSDVKRKAPDAGACTSDRPTRLEAVRSDNLAVGVDRSAC